MRISVTVLLVATIVGLSACQTTPERDDWLYRQLGEREGISTLNETFILEVARDHRISAIFQDTDINRLHRLLTQQFCALAGGPCTYTGRTMYDVHRDMHVTDTDFNALVEDLILAMESRDIPVSAQNRLLAQLAPMKDDIVGTEPPPSEPDRTFGVGDLRLSGYSARP